jgi:excisionase family DNA binding protein
MSAAAPTVMLRVEQAAERLGIQPATIRSWILSRRIGYVRIGRRAVRIPESEIIRIIQAGTVEPKSSASKRARNAKPIGAAIRE